MILSRRAFGSAAVFSLTAAAATLMALLAAGCTPQTTTDTATNSSSSGGGKTVGATPKELVFGFVPSAEADKIAEDAKPMAEFVAKEIGIPVKTFTSTNYVGLIEAMESGKVDIGSLPPLAYVLAKDQNAAEVLLKTSRKKSLTYKSMFVVRADSGIKKLEDAKGKRIAFVDPSSASGYLFPAAYMKAKGIEPESFFSQQMYAGAHDKAVMSVYNGDVDIATVYDDARNKLEKLPAYKDVKQKVVKIAETDPIPNDTISIRTGLDPALVAKIKAALLKYAQSPEGAKTLYDVYEVDALADAKDTDYDPVRQVAKTMDVQLSSFGDKKAAPAPAASPKP